MKIKSKFHNPKLRTKLLGTLMAAFAMVVLVSCQNEEAITDETTVEVGDLLEEDFGNKADWVLAYPHSRSYTLQNVKSKKYLATYRSSNGSNVRQLERWHGNYKFNIQLINSGKPQYFIELDKDEDKVLDVAGFKSGNGGNIHLWDKKNTANQHWIFERYRTTNIYRIKNDTHIEGGKDSNKYLSVHGSSYSAGANIVTWQKNSNRDQYWYLEEID